MNKPNEMIMGFGPDQKPIIDEILDQLQVEGLVTNYSSALEGEFQKYIIEFPEKLALHAAYRFGHAQASYMFKFISR